MIITTATRRPLVGALIAIAAALTASACASSSNAPPARSADQVVQAISQKVPTAKLTVVYTAATDRNHLLGRPGGYTSKSSFADSRIAPADVQGFTPGDVELGGSVEMYADASAAQARMSYIQAIAKGNPAFGEYDYAAGPALIRVSRLLAPDQAASYQAAAQQITVS
jgi:hypothetical protein